MSRRIKRKAPKRARVDRGLSMVPTEFKNMQNKSNVKKRVLTLKAGFDPSKALGGDQAMGNDSMAKLSLIERKELFSKFKPMTPGQEKKVLTSKKKLITAVQYNFSQGSSSFDIFSLLKSGKMIRASLVLTSEYFNLIDLTKSKEKNLKYPFKKGNLSIKIDLRNRRILLLKIGGARLMIIAKNSRERFVLWKTFAMWIHYYHDQSSRQLEYIPIDGTILGNKEEVESKAMRFLKLGKANFVNYFVDFRSKDTISVLIDTERFVIGDGPEYYWKDTRHLYFRVKDSDNTLLEVQVNKEKVYKIQTPSVDACNVLYEAFEIFKVNSLGDEGDLEGIPDDEGARPQKRSVEIKKVVNNKTMNKESSSASEDEERIRREERERKEREEKERKEREEREEKERKEREERERKEKERKEREERKRKEREERERREREERERKEREAATRRKDEDEEEELESEPEITSESGPETTLRDLSTDLFKYLNNAPKKPAKESTLERIEKEKLEREKLEQWKRRRGMVSAAGSLPGTEHNEPAEKKFHITLTTMKGQYVGDSILELTDKRITFSSIALKFSGSINDNPSRIKLGKVLSFRENNTVMIRYSVEGDEHSVIYLGFLDKLRDYEQMKRTYELFLKNLQKTESVNRAKEMSVAEKLKRWQETGVTYNVQVREDGAVAGNGHIFLVQAEDLWVLHYTDVTDGSKEKIIEAPISSVSLKIHKVRKAYALAKITTSGETIKKLIMFQDENSAKDIKRRMRDTKSMLKDLFSDGTEADTGTKKVSKKISRGDSMSRTTTNIDVAPLNKNRSTAFGKEERQLIKLKVNQIPGHYGRHGKAKKSVIKAILRRYKSEKYNELELLTLNNRIFQTALLQLAISEDRKDIVRAVVKIYMVNSDRRALVMERIFDYLRQDLSRSRENKFLDIFSESDLSVNLIRGYCWSSLEAISFSSGFLRRFVDDARRKTLKGNEFGDKVVKLLNRQKVSPNISYLFKNVCDILKSVSGEERLSKELKKEVYRLFFESMIFPQAESIHLFGVKPEKVKKKSKKKTNVQYLVEFLKLLSSRKSLDNYEVHGEIIDKDFMESFRTKIFLLFDTIAINDTYRMDKIAPNLVEYGIGLVHEYAELKKDAIKKKMRKVLGDGYISTSDMEEFDRVLNNLGSAIRT